MIPVIHQPLNLVDALEKYKKIRLPKWKKGKYLTIENNHLQLYVNNKPTPICLFKKGALLSKQWEEYKDEKITDIP